MNRTPGPWSFKPDSLPSGRITADPDETAIAGLIMGSDGDGNLMAAAPDLLAECKSLRAEIQSHNDDYHHVTSKERLASVDAAIAKAEGL